VSNTLQTRGEHVANTWRGPEGNTWQTHCKHAANTDCEPEGETRVKIRF